MFLFVVSLSWPVSVSEAVLLRGSARNPNSPGFSSSSAAWFCAQVQLLGVARPTVQSSSQRGGDRLRRLRDSGFLAVDVVEDAELLLAIASVHV